MKSLLIYLVKLYRLCISPLYPPCCRFYPSCSTYAIDALKIHGVFKGSALSVYRILRCHPLCSGGYDPVPPINNREITHGK